MCGYHLALLLQLHSDLLIRIDHCGLSGSVAYLGHVQKSQNVEILGIESLGELPRGLLDLPFGCLVGFALGDDLFEDLFAGFMKVFLGFLFFKGKGAMAAEVHVHNHLFVELAHLLIHIVILVLTGGRYHILEIVLVLQWPTSMGKPTKMFITHTIIV